MNHEASTLKQQPLWLTESHKLVEGSPLVLECPYNSKIISLILIRFSGICRAYINQCVHMPFRLDCESKQIFDHRKNKLKCSMHGIIYDLETGESLSPTMCTGEKLTAVSVTENEAGIWVSDPELELTPTK